LTLVVECHHTMFTRAVFTHESVNDAMQVNYTRDT